VVRLLETTLIRVGNDEYARRNKSFGLTTMRARHADVSETAIRFEFPGKGGKPWHQWALQEIGGWDSETQAKSNVVRAIESVSKKLGNTPAICRKSYIHPVVIDAYVDGSMVRTLARRARREIGSSLSGLSAEEAAILALLESRLRSEAARASKSA
jgi:DNA topoisomerase IB